MVVQGMGDGLGNMGGAAGQRLGASLFEKVVAADSC
jgi:hypothetical protein